MFCLVLSSVFTPFPLPKQLLEENIRKVKLSTPDYRDMDPEQAVRDFKERRANYMQIYEPIDDRDGPYVKIINSKQFIVNNIRGYLPLKVRWNNTTNKQHNTTKTHERFVFFFLFLWFACLLALNTYKRQSHVSPRFFCFFFGFLPPFLIFFAWFLQGGTFCHEFTYPPPYIFFNSSWTIRL